MISPLLLLLLASTPAPSAPCPALLAGTLEHERRGEWMEARVKGLSGEQVKLSWRLEQPFNVSCDSAGVHVRGPSAREAPLDLTPRDARRLEVSRADLAKLNALADAPDVRAAWATLETYARTAGHFSTGGEVAQATVTRVTRRLHAALLLEAGDADGARAELASCETQLPSCQRALEALESKDLQTVTVGPWKRIGALLGAPERVFPNEAETPAVFWSRLGDAVCVRQGEGTAARCFSPASGSWSPGSMADVAGARCEQGKCTVNHPSFGPCELPPPPSQPITGGYSIVALTPNGLETCGREGWLTTSFASSTGTSLLGGRLQCRLAPGAGCNLLCRDVLRNRGEYLVPGPASDRACVSLQTYTASTQASVVALRRAAPGETPELYVAPVQLHVAPFPNER